MDMFVREFAAGWSVCDSLRMGGSMAPLRMAAKAIGNVADVVAYSDRECKYAYGIPRRVKGGGVMAAVQDFTLSRTGTWFRYACCSEITFER